VAVIMQNRGSVVGVDNDALVAQSGAPFVEYNMRLPVSFIVLRGVCGHHFVSDPTVLQELLNVFGRFAPFVRVKGPELFMGRRGRCPA